MPTMTDVLTLDRSHGDEAIRLVAGSVDEIPLYRWLLGDHIDDAGKREWLAALMLRPLIRIGCVVGAFQDGRLCAVLAWQPHDADLAPDGTPPLTPADVAVAAQTPGLRERLVEFWTTQPLPLPADDAVCCVLTVVDDEVRGGDVLFDMMETVEEFCRTADRPFYAWTGSARLRDWFCRCWDVAPFATVEWNGHPMYGLVSGRPPVASSTVRAGRSVRTGRSVRSGA